MTTLYEKVRAETLHQLRETKALLTACADEECVDEFGVRSIAEPEQDGDLTYWTCLVCGYEFGYQRAPDPNAEPSCQLGIPESVRRQGSVEPERVPVTLGRRRAD